MESIYREMDEEIAEKVYKYNWKPGTTAYFLKLDENYRPVGIVKDVIFNVDRLYWKGKDYYSLDVRCEANGLSSVSIRYYPNKDKHGRKYYNFSEYIGCYTSEAKAKQDLKLYCEFYGIPVPRASRKTASKTLKAEDNPTKKRELLNNVYNQVLRRAGRPFGCTTMTNYYSIKPTGLKRDNGEVLKVEWLQPSYYSTDVLINWKTDRVAASDMSINELEQLIKIV